MIWLEQGSLFSGYAWELARTLLALLGLAGIVWLLTRRGVGLFGLRRSVGPLELVQQLALGPRRALYVVRAQQRLFVIGAAENGPLTLLAELDGEKPLESLPSVQPVQSGRPQVPARDERSDP